jgi:predicted nucleic acid-binding protein
MIPGSDILCTEDLATGRTEGQLTVVNPLVAT